jgi:hypothetical protein
MAIGLFSLLFFDNGKQDRKLREFLLNDIIQRQPLPSWRRSNDSKRACEHGRPRKPPPDQPSLFDGGEGEE